MLSMPSRTAHGDVLFGCCMIMQIKTMTMRIHVHHVRTSKPPREEELAAYYAAFGELSRRSWKHHQKPDAIPQKWSNMWKTCTAAVPLSLVQNVPAQLPPRKKGVISSSALSALMTWFVEHVLRLRTNESVQWHFTILVFHCFPVCKKAQIHHIMKEVMVRQRGMMFFGFFSKVHTKTTHPFYREDVDNPLAPRKAAQSHTCSRIQVLDSTVPCVHRKLSTIPWGTGILVPWELGYWYHGILWDWRHSAAGPSIIGV